MNDQYSPERDRNRLQTLKILAIIVTALLVVSAGISVYKLEQSQTYDSAGHNMENPGSSSSTQPYSGSGAHDSGVAGSDSSAAGSSGSAPSSGSGSDERSWEENNPELVNIVTQCGDQLDFRIIDDATSLSGRPITTFYERGIGFAYDATNETNRQGMTCVGSAIGAPDPDLFYEKITSLGRANQDPPGTDFTRSTLPMIPADGKAANCVSFSAAPDTIFCSIRAESVNLGNAADPPVE
ncbi:hypothetical protein COO72_09050 [Bifidobacterium callitrichos]|nr:hypothetical protein COO72_09050 [Bifidobacterium callitrichos]